MTIDRNAAIQFLQTAFRPDDWIAVLLKPHQGSRVAQRVVPVSLAVSPRIQDWMERANLAGHSVYVSVNAVTPMQTSRSRRAIVAVRHVFLDVDYRGAEVVRRVAGRRDLPLPSYVLNSSPDRVHLFWRADGFSRGQVEALQKRLARELDADPAATACSQLTRLPGFENHKYQPVPRVTVEYHDVERVFTPGDFPMARTVEASRFRPSTTVATAGGDRAIARARRYTAAVAPAVTGRHGDMRTFQLCCRLVRGFGLSDADAMSVLATWNRRCRPPWTERELADKIRRARQYGREPVGGLLEASRRPDDVVSS